MSAGRGLWDAHVHLDAMANADRVAAHLRRADVRALCCTTTPDGWRRARERGFGREGGVRLAAGAHPWWVADGRVGPEDVDDLCRVIESDMTHLVGEVGLDFSPRHVGDGVAAGTGRGAQLDAFARIARACGNVAQRTGRPRVLSIHSVASAGEVLDGLGTEGLLDAGPRRCECVLHWFSGSSDELWRAIRAGCWFSVGERMTSTRRGREYCRLIPSGRLLLETDLPEVPGASCPVGSIPSSLARAVSALASIRGASADDIAHVTTENAEGLLARDGGLAQHAEGADPAPAR